MNGKLLKLGLPNMDSQRWYHDIRSGALVCFHETHRGCKLKVG